MATANIFLFHLWCTCDVSTPPPAATLEWFILVAHMHAPYHVTLLTDQAAYAWSIVHTLHVYIARLGLHLHQAIALASDIRHTSNPSSPFDGHAKVNDVVLAMKAQPVRHHMVATMT